MLLPASTKLKEDLNLFPREPWIDRLLRETFQARCEEDCRRAVSCARVAPSRSNIAPPPRGNQRFTVHGGDIVVRAPHASQMRYTLRDGGLALDIFKQALEEILRPFGAVFSLEFEDKRLSAYTIKFS